MHASAVTVVNDNKFFWQLWAPRPPGRFRSADAAATPAG